MGNTLTNPVTDKETITGTLSSHRQQENCISFAYSSCQGWRITQEDAHFLQTKLCIPAASSINRNKKDDGGDTQYLNGHAIFCLFDGHGGSFVANYASQNFCSIFYQQQEYIDYCRKYLDHLQEKMQGGKRNTRSRRKKGRKIYGGNDLSVPSKKVLDQDGSLLELLEVALKKTFLDVDKKMLVAMKLMQTENKDAVRMEGRKVAENGFELMDAGSAALILLLTPNHILCANAGDCRAILCKRPASMPPMEEVTNRTEKCPQNPNYPLDVIPLSFDHKPDDPAEEKRIFQAGGSVSGGKIDGVLALSRGLGDFSFKDHDSVIRVSKDGIVNNSNRSIANTACIPPEQQKVCPLPDFISVDRDEINDLFLTIACDGIWDVVTNEQCANLISTIFQDGESDLGLLSEEVIDVCLKKGSRDNMSIFIVKFHSQEIGKGGGLGRGGAAEKVKRMKRYCGI